MGASAHNRGSVAIARQIQADYQASGAPARIERATYRAMVAAAEANTKAVEHDLTRAKRLIGVLQAQRTILREQLAEADATIKKQMAERSEAAKIILRLREIRAKLSRFVKDHATPAEWRSWSEEYRVMSS